MRSDGAPMSAGTWDGSWTGWLALSLIIMQTLGSLVMTLGIVRITLTLGAGQGSRELMGAIWRAAGPVVVCSVTLTLLIVVGYSGVFALGTNVMRVVYLAAPLMTLIWFFVTRATASSMRPGALLATWVPLTRESPLPRNAAEADLLAAVEARSHVHAARVDADFMPTSFLDTALLALGDVRAHVGGETPLDGVAVDELLAALEATFRDVYEATCRVPFAQRYTLAAVVHESTLFHQDVSSAYRLICLGRAMVNPLVLFESDALWGRSITRPSEVVVDEVRAWLHEGL